MDEATAAPLTSTYAGDPDFAELLTYFCEQIQVRINELTAASTTGDLPKLQTTAHQLKGAAAGFGYPTVGQAAGSLENLIRGVASPDLEQIRTATQELVDLCRRVSA